MDIRLTRGRASVQSVTAISSKSYVHRLLIGAALCERKVNVVTNIVSKDMEATMRALEKLSSGTVLADSILDCGESGSTARFILPLASLLSPGSTLTGSGRLPERPMGPLCDVLRKAGVEVSGDHLPITVNGVPHAGRYEIPGDVSSQFISGLLFMLPLLDGDSHLTVKGSMESAAYVDMTLDVLAKFGIEIIRTADGFDIPGGQKYRSAFEGDEKGIVAEGDWSNGAFIMAMASLGCGSVFDEMTVSGLNPDSIQGDRAILEIMDNFGIEVREHRCEECALADYTIKGKPVRPVDIECSQIPDLVPALAVIAAFADGDSVFRNVGRLRVKECDRVEAVKYMLGAINVMVDITSEDGRENMIVHGKKNIQFDGDAIVINSFNDHRIAMASAAIAFAQDKSVVIEDAMATDKSYPGFYDVITSLGIKCEGV